MLEMDGSSNPPQQISEMFQKFALAFKAKTFEFFAEEGGEPEDSDGFSLLDSAEEIITDQKVVVIKPDGFSEPPITTTTTTTKKKKNREYRLKNPQLAQTLISSIFATVSKFEASYLQLQTSHVPFAEESVKSADRALVSHLLRLSEFKRLYFEFCCGDNDLGSDFRIGSCLEAQVEENQSKLRTLGTVSDKLQEEIDRKDDEVLALRTRLEEIQTSNSDLSARLNGDDLNRSREGLLSFRVFDSVLNDACRSTHRFTKILIESMRVVGWDLDMAADSVHPGIDYAKRTHNRYALLSYVCLGMFRNFDSRGFEVCEGNVSGSPMSQLLEHVACEPTELLSRNRDSEFSRFCEGKYQEIIHRTMESSIFGDMDKKEAVLSSWRSLSTFYETYVNMASSIWTLHKLAFSFHPPVGIFRVEKGVDFSLVYMKDVTKRSVLIGGPVEPRTKVGFTVFPGFKIGKTVIQSQVYLSKAKCL